MFETWLREVPVQTQLVVLPEMFSTGFTMHSRDVAETMRGETVVWLQQQATSLKKTLCGSVVIEDAGRFYNRMLWIEQNGEVGVYDKRHRFRMAGEHEHFEAGTSRPVFKCGNWRILPCICYDLRFPVWLRNRSDYDLLLCVANWPAARRHAWRSLITARAIENQAFVAAVNILGTDGNGVDYSGDSLVVKPDGVTQLDARDVAGVYSTSLELDELQRTREQFPVWQDADEFELDRGD